MKLIVGLGNPGKEYKNTRHNVGFKAVEEVGRHFGMKDIGLRDKLKATLAQGTVAGEKVILAKPQTFMNLSGEAVYAVMHYFKIQPRNLIVIYDDFVIAPGKVRIRPSGSAGGHNGMQSIMDILKTDEIVRIRIGIAPFNAWQGTHTDYVLGRLTPQENEMMETTFKKMPEIIETLLSEGLDEAMQRYN
ncbi:aminoacyl-tRNA hydrolase [Candidatus Peregrinibacteria bacterium]|nr:aminoacyl-tRNA hydrolase [Candidatus Peregrinibacteria bacterium]